MTVIYAMVTLVALISIGSLAVDYGRVRLAKTELQQIADSAARYGASALSLGPATVKSRVLANGAENKVDGKPLVFDTTADIDFGTWNPVTGEFAVLPVADQSSATAIRVTARRAASRGTGVPTMLAASLGRSTIDIKASAIASRGKIVSQSIDADSCLWLAGMPNNSIVAKEAENTKDSKAPAQSPTLVTGLNFTSGTRLSFQQISGTTNWDDGSDGTFGPDGDTTWIVQQTAANGINTTLAPIGSMVGIFLDDRTPNTYSQAGSLNFSTSASRNFSTLSPQLKQVFFIGDGMNSSGSLQEFVVPTGATRLYLGIMDEKGWWWDNNGTLSTILIDDNVQTVK